MSGNRELPAEKLKEEVLGGTDEERACRALKGNDETKEAARAAERRMKAGVYAPLKEEMKEVRPQIDARLKSGDVTVLVPMLETGGPPHFTPRSVLDYLIKNCSVPKAKILVIDGGSGPAALEEVRKNNVPMIRFPEVVHRVFKPIMCGLLSLSSEEFRGKGIQMSLGLLVVETMRRMGIIGSSLVHFHDSELIGVDEYDGTRYEMYPFVKNPSRHLHSQAIQVGRNNETVHGVRTAMQALAHTHPDRKVRQYLHKIWERYASLVWMCTGERILDWTMAMQLPFTTGYCMEAILALGTIGYDLEKVGDPAQVVIPNPRLDGANGKWAEQIMMNMISRFMIMSVMTGIPPHEWNLGTISDLNGHFEQMPFVPILPKEPGRVVCHPKTADRIIPSTNVLLDQGFVDTDELRRIAEECLDL